LFIYWIIVLAKNSKNIFLIGPMGAGKSTIGKILAKRLDLDFWDSDQVIVEQTGASINTIFEHEGESGFRIRENEIIAELVEKQGVLVATGGGVVLDANNRKLLADKGIVIHLKVGLEKQIERAKNDTNRPLLQGKDLRQTLTELDEKRSKLYEEISNFSICTDDGGHIDKIIAEILDALKTYGYK